MLVSSPPQLTHHAIEAEGDRYDDYNRYGNDEHQRFYSQHDRYEDSVEFSHSASFREQNRYSSSDERCYYRNEHDWECMEVKHWKSSY